MPQLRSEGDAALSQGRELSALWEELLSNPAAPPSTTRIPTAHGCDKRAVWLIRQRWYLLFQRLYDCLLDLIHLLEAKGVITESQNHRITE